jgi:hypothetical protein
MDLRTRQKAVKLEGLRLKGRAAFPRNRSVNRSNGRAELACGEGIDGAETRGKLDGGEAAFAKEPAQKIRGRFVPFLRIAFQAAGDEIPIAVLSQRSLRHDMVQASHLACEAAEAVKAPAVLTLVDRLAKGLGLQEIGLLEVICRRQRSGILGFDLVRAGSRGENFFG